MGMGMLMKKMSSAVLMRALALDGLDAALCVQVSEK